MKIVKIMPNNFFEPTLWDVAALRGKVRGRRGSKRCYAEENK